MSKFLREWLNDDALYMKIFAPQMESPKSARRIAKAVDRLLSGKKRRGTHKEYFSGFVAQSVLFKNREGIDNYSPEFYRLLRRFSLAKHLMEHNRYPVKVAVIAAGLKWPEELDNPTTKLEDTVLTWS